MPHLFCDGDDFIPGGLGGLDDGDVVHNPNARPPIPEDAIPYGHAYSPWFGGNNVFPVYFVDGEFRARCHGNDASLPIHPSSILSPFAAKILTAIESDCPRAVRRLKNGTGKVKVYYVYGAWYLRVTGDTVDFANEYTLPENVDGFGADNVIRAIRYG